MRILVIILMAGCLLSACGKKPNTLETPVAEAAQQQQQQKK